MAVQQPRYSKEEFAQRGDAIYEAQFRIVGTVFLSNT
jgi:hypothetical protein